MFQKEGESLGLVWGPGSRRRRTEGLRVWTGEGAVPASGERCLGPAGQAFSGRVESLLPPVGRWPKEPRVHQGKAHFLLGALGAR